MALWVNQTCEYMHTHTFPVLYGLVCLPSHQSINAECLISSKDNKNTLKTLPVKLKKTKCVFFPQWMLMRAINCPSVNALFSISHKHASISEEIGELSFFWLEFKTKMNLVSSSKVLYFETISE